MKIKKYIISFSSILSISFITGCNFSSIDSKGISGVVEDGYIDRAKVCIDKNNNNKCDFKEYYDYSQDGKFQVSYEGKLGKLVAELNKTESVDLDNGEFVKDNISLSAPIGEKVISPITTLVDINLPLLAPEVSEVDMFTNAVSFVTGYNNDYSAYRNDFFSDYIANNNRDLEFISKNIMNVMFDVKAEMQNILETNDINQTYYPVYRNIINNIIFNNSLNLRRHIDINITQSFNDLNLSTEKLEFLKNNPLKTEDMYGIWKIENYSFGPKWNEDDDRDTNITRVVFNDNTYLEITENMQGSSYYIDADFGNFNNNNRDNVPFFRKEIGDKEENIISKDDEYLFVYGLNINNLTYNDNEADMDADKFDSAIYKFNSLKNDMNETNITGVWRDKSNSANILILFNNSIYYSYISGMIVKSNYIYDADDNNISFKVPNQDDENFDISLSDDNNDMNFTVDGDDEPSYQFKRAY